VTLSSAASINRGHKCRSTFRLWARASASMAKSVAPITPVVPRKVSGGSSLNRYFVTGQLNPQPTEVMARNIRPAGQIRAGAVGFDSVMEPGKGRKSDGIRRAPWRVSASPTTDARTCQTSPARSGP
jgi:hypothetical protein